jgi:hypothetical protein
MKWFAARQNEMLVKRIPKASSAWSLALTLGVVFAFY